MFHAKIRTKFNEKLKHVPPIKLQHSTYPDPHIECVIKTQAPLPEDESPLLPSQGVKFIQSMIWATLCLARIIDSTLLVGCKEIATQQTTATTKTLSLAKFMLDHMSSNPDPFIKYCKSDMQLWVVSDYSCLSVSKSRRRVGGFHYLGNTSNHEQLLPQQ